MTIGGECTRWIEHASAYCGAPTTHLRRDPATDEIIDVSCAAHRAQDSEPIPIAYWRAGPSVYTPTVAAPPPIRGRRW